MCMMHLNDILRAELELNRRRAKLRRDEPSPETPGSFTITRYGSDRMNSDRVEACSDPNVPTQGPTGLPRRSSGDPPGAKLGRVRSALTKP